MTPWVDRDFLGSLFPAGIRRSGGCEGILETSFDGRVWSAFQSKGFHLLVFEHLNGVVPSHSSVRGSTSDKDNFGLSILGKIDGLSGIGAGGGFGNSVSVDKSGGSSGCEGEHGDCNRC